MAKAVRPFLFVVKKIKNDLPLGIELQKRSLKYFSTMIRTTSIKHYKELKAKGISCELVTKADLNTKF